MIELGRHPDRGRYDFATIASILDESLMCHVGLSTERGPLVVPTIAGRIEQTLYVHGSVLTRWMSDSDDRRVCVTASIVDGLVLARSIFAHSMNYRSVMIFGVAQIVADDAERARALRAISDRVCPDRWDHVRPPSKNELRATRVLRVALDTASAKVRTGPPVDASGDLDSRSWAGVVPLSIVPGEPISDPALDATIGVPPHVRALAARRQQNGSG